jgi:kynurenine formamidase
MEYKAKTIDEIPLERCFGEGLVIDMKHKADFDAIAIQDIEHFLKTEKLALGKGIIVLIKTGRNKFNGTKDFPYKGTGMSARATEWLRPGYKSNGYRLLGMGFALTLLD